MDGVDVSVMGWSSTLVNVSPSTYPSCMRGHQVCFAVGASLSALGYLESAPLLE